MDKQIQAKVKQLYNRFPARSWHAGQLLVQADDDPSGVYFIEKGSVRQYTIDYRGEEIVVNTFHEGSFFPMSWALNRTNNQFYFDTVEDSVLRCAPRKDIIAFLNQNSDVAMDLLERVYSGVDGVLMRMVHLMSSSAYVRVLYELILQTKRLHVQDDKNVTLPMSELELGTYCGLARETVSREFKKLKDKSLLIVNARRIIVPDVTALESELAKHQ